MPYNVKLNNLPEFPELIINYGLPSDRSAQALMLYAQTLGRWFEKGLPIRPNYFKTLFRNIATLYGVTPESMVQHWPAIDQVIIKLNVPMLPYDEHVRQAKPNWEKLANKSLAAADAEIMSSMGEVKKLGDDLPAHQLALIRAKNRSE